MATDTQLALTILEASGQSEAELPIPRILAVIPLALLGLVRKANLDPDWWGRQFLVRQFADTSVTAGVGDLTPLVSGTRPAAVQYNKSWEVYIDTVPGRVQMVADRSMLALDQPPGYAYGCVTGLTLYVDDNTGTPYTGLAHITGLFLPTINDIYNGELNGETVNIALSILRGGESIPNVSQ